MQGLLEHHVLLASCFHSTSICKNIQIRVFFFKFNFYLGKCHSQAGGRILVKCGLLSPVWDLCTGCCGCCPKVGWGPQVVGDARCLLPAETAWGRNTWEVKGRWGEDWGDRGSLEFWLMCDEPPGQGSEHFVMGMGWVLLRGFLPAWGDSGLGDGASRARSCPLHPSAASDPAGQRWAALGRRLSPLLGNHVRKKNQLYWFGEKATRDPIYWQLAGNKAAAVKLYNKYHFAGWILVPCFDYTSPYKRKYWGF